MRRKTEWRKLLEGETLFQVGMVLAFFIALGAFVLDIFLRIVSHGANGL